MAVLIEDYLKYVDAAGVSHPLVGYSVYLYPVSRPFFFKEGGEWFNTQKPFEREAVSDVNGRFQVEGVSSADGNPVNAIWQLKLPNGEVWQGIFADNLPSPITLEELRQNGWEQIDPNAYGPIKATASGPAGADGAPGANGVDGIPRQLANAGVQITVRDLLDAADGTIGFVDTGVKNEVYVKALTRDLLIDATGGDRIFYVHPTLGSDSNDGLTSGTAFQTFDKAVAKFAGFWTGKARIILLGPLTLNVAKTYAVAGGIGPNAEPLFIIGSFTDQIGTRTATAGTTGTKLFDSTLSMTTDQYAGAIARMTSGSAAGTRRTIVSNDATSFTLAASIGSAVAGNTFVIERPGTTINVSATLTFRGYSPLAFLGIKFAMTGGVVQSDLFSQLWANGCEFSAVSGSPITQALQGGRVDFGGGLIASTFDFSAYGISGSMASSGCYFNGMFAVRSNGAGAFIFLTNCLIKNTTNVVPLPLGRMDISACEIVGGGGVGGSNSEGATLRFVSGTIRDVTGVGLRGSQQMIIRTFAGTINNCTSHGAQIDRGCYADLSGLTGTGNGGNGVYVGPGGKCITDATTANDTTGLRGTAGNAKVGNHAAVTWATITAGNAADVYDQTTDSHLQKV